MQPFLRSLVRTPVLFPERTTEVEPLYAYDPLSFTPSGKAIPIRIVRVRRTRSRRCNLMQPFL
jgi:hypothetical protein